MIVNAILYLVDAGIKWRQLPKDCYPPWQTVYWYFSKWTKDGSWSAVNEELVMIRRQSTGGDPLPSVLVIDSQSVKNTATATANTGVDGGKKIKGRKRLMLTDGQGNLLAVKVFAANHHDGPSALKWWLDRLMGYPLLSRVSVIKADHHFGGVFKKGVEAAGQIRVRISNTLVQKAAQTAMPVHKGRWVVERTIAWESNSRRLSKDYERLPQHAEACLIISSISRLLRQPFCLN